MSATCNKFLTSVINWK